MRSVLFLWIKTWPNVVGLQMYAEDPTAKPTEISLKNKELIAMLTEEHSQYLVNPSITIPAPTFVGGTDGASTQR